MQRRQYLAATATGLAGTLAGCASGDSDADDGPGDPTEAMQTYIERVNAGDGDAVNEMIADDGDFETLTAEDAAVLEEMTVELDSAETLERDSEEARVEATIRFVQGERVDAEHRVFTLRAMDGEWRLWAAEDA